MNVGLLITYTSFQGFVLEVLITRNKIMKLKTRIRSSSFKCITLWVLNMNNRDLPKEASCKMGKASAPA